MQGTTNHGKPWNDQIDQRGLEGERVIDARIPGVQLRRGLFGLVEGRIGG